MPYETTGTTTAEKVFELAINLMDELNDSGEYDYADTDEYRNRTLGILNILKGELYPFSDTFRKNQEWERGRRPIVSAITAFDQVIDLDDYICQSVMPYGLAAHLLMDENPASAGFFQQRKIGVNPAACRIKLIIQPAELDIRSFGDLNAVFKNRNSAGIAVNGVVERNGKLAEYHSIYRKRYRLRIFCPFIDGIKRHLASQNVRCV